MLHTDLERGSVTVRQSCSDDIAGNKPTLHDRDDEVVFSSLPQTLGCSLVLAQRGFAVKSL